jgi:hypothetical protein
MRASLSTALLATALLLGGCAERAQTADTRKADGKPWEGAQNTHVAAGWKAGDQASWEQQLKARSQGQNEYTRTAARP